MILSFYLYEHNRNLHSFPTRRSSDLDSGIHGECRCAGNAADTRSDPHFESRQEDALLPGFDLGNVRQGAGNRSEEHTSELQSQFHIVCRLLLEKKKPMDHSIPYLKGY